MRVEGLGFSPWDAWIWEFPKIGGLILRGSIWGIKGVPPILGDYPLVDSGFNV